MEAETHRYGKLEWLLYIVVLPLLFTALLSGIILQFLGFDITGKIATAAKQIPGVSRLISDDSNPASADAAKQASADQAKQLQETQDKLTALETAKKQLEDDLVKKNSEIDRLKKQVDDAKKKDTKTETQAANKDPIQETAKVYANMSPSEAADILSKLSVTEAKMYLSKMTSDEQAAILEKMDATIAAKILAAS